MHKHNNNIYTPYVHVTSTTLPFHKINKSYNVHATTEIYKLMSVFSVSVVYSYLNCI